MMSPVTNDQPATESTTPIGSLDDNASFYDRFGGHEFFERLVANFYAGVGADPVLREMYPERDLGPAARRLRMFLEQYWGGPTTYSQERGHPRLRMRHEPFHVDGDARDRWLTHMFAALDAEELPDDLDEELRDYLVRAAYSMVNRADPL
jgi:hemoglobin